MKKATHLFKKITIICTFALCVSLLYYTDMPGSNNGIGLLTGVETVHADDGVQEFKPNSVSFFLSEGENTWMKAKCIELDEDKGKWVGDNYVYDPEQCYSFITLVVKGNLFYWTQWIDGEYVKVSDDTMICEYDSKNKVYRGIPSKLWSEGSEFEEPDYPIVRIPKSSVSIKLNGKNEEWLRGNHKGTIDVNFSGIKTNGTFPVKTEDRPGIVFEKRTIKKKGDNFLSYNLGIRTSDAKITNSNNNVVKLGTFNGVWDFDVVGAGQCDLKYKYKDGTIEKKHVVVKKDFVVEYFKKCSSVSKLYDTSSAVSRHITIDSFPYAKISIKIGKKTYKGKTNRYGHYNFVPKIILDKGQKVKVILNYGDLKKTFKRTVKTSAKPCFVRNKGKYTQVLMGEYDAPKKCTVSLKIGKKTYKTKKIKRVFLYGDRAIIKTGKLKKNQKMIVKVTNRKGTVLFKKKIKLKNRKWRMK